MNKKVLALATLLVVSLSGCTDAAFDKITNYGDSAHVLCYSGGKVVFDGHSTGKIKAEETSDGYFFRWKERGTLVEVSGQCIFEYK